MIKSFTWLYHAIRHTLRGKIKPLRRKMKYSKRQMLSVQATADRLAEAISEGKPLLAGRMGFFEQAVMRMYEFKIEKKYAVTIKNLYDCAGFFPQDIALGGRFTEVMKDAMLQADIYACNKEFLEEYFINICLPKDSIICPDISIYDVFKLERP